MIHNPTSIIIGLEKNLKDLKKKNKNSVQVLISLCNLGRKYKVIHSYDKARLYFHEALRICELIINSKQSFESNDLFITKKYLLDDLAEVQFKLKNSQ